MQGSAASVRGRIWPNFEAARFAAFPRPPLDDLDATQTGGSRDGSGGAPNAESRLPRTKQDAHGGGCVMAAGRWGKGGMQGRSGMVHHTPERRRAAAVTLPPTARWLSAASVKLESCYTSSDLATSGDSSNEKKSFSTHGNCDAAHPASRPCGRFYSASAPLALARWRTQPPAGLVWRRPRGRPPRFAPLSARLVS